MATQVGQLFSAREQHNTTQHNTESEEMALLRGAVCKNVSIFANPRRPRTGFPVFAIPSSRTISNHSLWQASRHGIRALNNQAVAEPKPSVKEDGSSHNWRIKMLYDGDCPLCMREVNMLRERNKLYGAIKFVDISSDEYSPEENQGLDYETVMGRIHAILSDGTVVTDVEAFRRLYEEVGLGWVYAVTKYEPIATIVNAVYALWAKYRLQITGRPPLEEVLEARRKNRGEVCKNSKTCDI